MRLNVSLCEYKELPIQILKSKAEKTSPIYIVARSRKRNSNPLHNITCYGESIKSQYKRNTVDEIVGTNEITHIVTPLIAKSFQFDLPEIRPSQTSTVNTPRLAFEKRLNIISSLLQKNKDLMKKNRKKNKTNVFITEDLFQNKTSKNKKVTRNQIARIQIDSNCKKNKTIVEEERKVNNMPTFKKSIDGNYKYKWRLHHINNIQTQKEIDILNSKYKKQEIYNKIQNKIKLARINISDLKSFTKQKEDTVC